MLGSILKDLVLGLFHLRVCVHLSLWDRDRAALSVEEQ